MKKFLPYILIIVIVANIFAPFSVFIGQNNSVFVKENAAEAADAWIKESKGGKDGLIINLKLVEIRDGTIPVYKINITWPELGTNKDGKKLTEKITLVIFKEDGSDRKDLDITSQVLVNRVGLVDSSDTLINNLDEETSYISFLQVEQFTEGIKDRTKYEVTLPTINFTTSKKGSIKKEITDPSGESSNIGNAGSADFLPDCVEGFADIDLVGCAIVLYYNILFVPTSYLFGLGGKFFDATFGYSIQDSSYRSGFVTEGWAIVRDFCNLFFIFVLIYAAFGMILSIHSIKSKEIIINTIIIGLLINFSLLAGQILIDTSNILARVFYNSEAIKITVDKNGGVVDRGGVNMYDTTMGELPLSAALVSKVDPQNLIINGKDKIQGAKSKSSSDDYQGITAGGWFLIITLAIIVNIIGTFVFLSVGLIFVARVIGLWFALIFAPLAFFSYTVPQMQGIAMVGWKKWWPETMGLAFVAPIFMFFMYLILVFLERGFVSLLEASDGPNFVLSIIIPFAFIMILLMTAKKLAKDYSGQMGQMITQGVTAVGAVALGGAALGVAFAGRTAIGRPLKAVSNSRSALHMDEHKEKMKSYSTKYEEWKKNGSIGPAPVKPIAPQHGDVIGKNKNGKDIKYNALVGAWGSQMNSRETDQGHIIHTRHELDEISKKEFNGQTYGELGAGQKQKAKDLLTDEKAKKKYDKIARDEYGMDYKDSSMGINEKKRVRDLAKMMAKNDVEHSADSKISAGSTFQTSMRKGSYDVRNLSALGTNNMDSIFNKLGTKLMVGIGMGMRMGFKSSGINHGTGQKDFFKDIGNTITEALKNVKIEVPKGGGGGHDDHGGGHDDHGHGGGGGGHH